MRARYLSGMIYSSFRRARSSVLPNRRVDTRRLWLSTNTEKTPYAVSQRMQFARKYDNAEDLVCPVKYFKEEVEFLISLDSNELLKLIGKKGISEVSMKLAKAVRSLAAIILDNHSVGIACGDSLRLSNLRISRSLGEFAMIEPPKPDTKDDLLGDFSRGADLLEELARLVLGPDVVMPRVWKDFIGKMREEFPRVELIMYHSLFLPLNLRIWLRIIVDQRFRKDFDSLTKDEKNAVRSFLLELGKMRNEDLDSLVPNNEFLKFLSLRSRSGSKGRKGKSNSDLIKPEAVWGDKARDIIAYNRDGVVHGCKKASEEEKAAMPNIKRHWRTQENIIPLLSEVFELIEQDYIDLCYDKEEKVHGNKEKALWYILGMPELFGETQDTWKAAKAAIVKAMEKVDAANSTSEA